MGSVGARAGIPVLVGAVKMLPYILIAGLFFWIGNAVAPRQPVIAKFVKADPPQTYAMARSMSCTEVSRSCRATERMEKVVQR